MEEESMRMRGKRVEEWAKREQGSGVDKGRGVGKGGTGVRVGRGGYENGMMRVGGGGLGEGSARVGEKGIGVGEGG